MLSEYLSKVQTFSITDIFRLISELLYAWSLSSFWLPFQIPLLKFPFALASVKDTLTTWDHPIILLLSFWQWIFYFQYLQYFKWCQHSSNLWASLSWYISLCYRNISWNFHCLVTSAKVLCYLTIQKLLWYYNLENSFECCLLSLLLSALLLIPALVLLISSLTTLFCSQLILVRF